MHVHCGGGGRNSKYKIDNGKVEFNNKVYYIRIYFMSLIYYTRMVFESLPLSSANNLFVCCLYM
jgi:hypothetical protein